MALGIFKKLLGDKTTKDRKEYQPSIDKTNEKYNHEIKLLKITNGKILDQKRKLKIN